MSERNPFEIDENALAEEWLKQPMLAHRHGEALADARLAVDKAAAVLSVTRADLDLDIRQNPDEYDVPKITESIVASTIETDAHYKEAVKKVALARHAMRIAEAAVTAIEHKKRSLEKLVDLHGMDYWAAPRAKQKKEGLSTAEKKQVTRRKGVKKP